ncbi:MAG: hypothetical protein KKI02_07105 [Planctomycetes bacterium]|nr:hypothetical protein [Planctomycetota bacterium]
MRKTRHLAIGAAGLALLVPSLVGSELLLNSPGFPPSKVDEQGVIHEDWGTVALCLRQPEGAKRISQRCDEETVPTAITAFSAGVVTLTQTAYRAPIWPSGMDVLTARLENTAAEAVEVSLDVTVPKEVSFGESTGMLGGRAVIGLPKGVEPVREEQPWGCTGGVVPMPGWAKPQGQCDSAFRNISAGMGGVPIVYRFAVPPGSKQTVVLGFCESHWPSAGIRPLEIYVEGASKSEIDPIAAWGRHVPGCLRFDAIDSDEDGRLQIVIAPHPKAGDKNTILNVIWVFPPDVYVDTDEVLRGKLNGAAQYYVDVGGENDQLLYKGGKLTYQLRLEPNEEQELTFFLASPGVRAVPNPETTAWTVETLRRAAEDVWAGHQAARPE